MLYRIRKNNHSDCYVVQYRQFFIWRTVKYAKCYGGDLVYFEHVFETLDDARSKVEALINEDLTIRTDIERKKAVPIFSTVEYWREGSNGFPEMSCSP